MDYVDEVQSELLNIQREHNTAIITAIWKAIGTLGYVPKALRSGLYAPIFKKGNTREPSSYRPIALLSHIRKAISHAVNATLLKEYIFHPLQWGFTSNLATEDAITYAGRPDHLPYRPTNSQRYKISLDGHHGRSPREEGITR